MSDTHDLSSREWGCNYNIIQIYKRGMNLDLCGWHKGIKNGDYIILKNGTDTTRYKVDLVKYESEPRDMWNASVSFSPRSASEG